MKNFKKIYQKYLKDPFFGKVVGCKSGCLLKMKSFIYSLPEIFQNFKLFLMIYQR